jgi:vancomycin resistance protein YoaR
MTRTASRAAGSKVSNRSSVSVSASKSADIPKLKYDRDLQRKLRKNRIERARRRRRLFIILGSFFALAIAYGAIYFSLWSKISKIPKDQVLGNVFIGTTDVSNMTLSQMEVALQSNLDRYSQMQIALNVNGKSALINLSEIAIRYEDVSKLATEAMNYGKSGNIFSRYFLMKKLAKKPMVFAETFAINEAAAKVLIQERAVPLANHAKNATITKLGNGLTINPEESGTTVNIEETVAKIVNFLNTDWTRTNFTLAVEEMVDQPTIYASQLTDVKDILGTFGTNAGGGERWQNLQTGMSKINGSIVMPGEIFSVHDACVPFDAENGYVIAPSFAGNTVEESYGGGICQVSTTLYNAVILAELEVRERHSHTMLVTYADPSKDAAIAGDVKDFRFVNNTGYPIYIAGEIDDSNILRFTIFGKEYRDPNRTIKYQSEILEQEDYGVTYKENKESPLGKLEKTGSPHNGMLAQLWKIVYLNGEEQSREIVNKSQYKVSNEIVEVGTQTNVAAAANIVRNAIRTQDKPTIDAAIAEAKAVVREAGQ